MAKTKTTNRKVCTLLGQDFGDVPLHELVSATRQFPITSRLDLQTALLDVLSRDLAPIKQIGVHLVRTFCLAAQR